ncbi:UDP-N-acetyl-D-mannosamine dehydrogenase [Arthrobacter sp. NPDC090010]|uniref:UDP-N-acetyl-D-mannosamine dehydrogenase n=1 Tax=Arthrobacter sp. NPDC090010 TaxID=3363942 RepID=UPI0038259633
MSTFDPKGQTPPASTVAVLGLGYIGLPTAAILATAGLRVIGMDIDPRVVEAVNAGEVPFTEPELGVTVAGAVSLGLLSAQGTVPEADTYIVAVPTPFAEDKSADLSYIRAAAGQIAERLKGGELVILESTSPPGTTRLMADEILGIRPDLSLDGTGGRPVVRFAHCPERVLPGRIMAELVSNDRIVGGLTPEATLAAAELYATFCKAEIHLTDATTAEMAKLAENAYRDVNIAFANELSLISDRLGLDVWELIGLANKHPRVDILRPGPGVGGHCIAVDPWFIVAADPENSRLIRSARTVNDSKPGHVVRQVLDAVGEAVDSTVAVLGLAFKADVDDFRESPALGIAAELSRTLPNARLLVAEPYAESLPAELAASPNTSLVTATDAVSRADVVVLLVDHQQFRAIDPELLSGKTVLDTRGVWHTTDGHLLERSE